MKTQAPAGYRAVPVPAWSAVLLAVAFPVAAAFVPAAYPPSIAELCVDRPALYPLPPLVVGMVWPGVAGALIVLAALPLVCLFAVLSDLYLVRQVLDTGWTGY